MLAERYTLLPAGKRDLSGGQDKMKQKKKGNDRAAQLGQISGLKKNSQAIEDVCPQNYAAYKKSMQDHKNSQGNTGKHLHPVQSGGRP